MKTLPLREEEERVTGAVYWRLEVVPELLLETRVLADRLIAELLLVVVVDERPTDARRPAPEATAEARREAPVRPLFTELEEGLEVEGFELRKEE